MAKQGGIDLAKKVVSGTFSATGSSVDFTPVTPSPFNIVLSGAGTASIQLEATYDGGTTWCQISAAGTQFYAWNYAGTAFVERYEEIERGVAYRLRCTSYTSAVDYRISQ